MSKIERRASADSHQVATQRPEQFALSIIGGDTISKWPDFPCYKLADIDFCYQV